MQKYWLFGKTLINLNLWEEKGVNNTQSTGEYYRDQVAVVTGGASGMSFAPARRQCSLTERSGSSSPKSTNPPIGERAAEHGLSRQGSHSEKRGERITGRSITLSLGIILGKKYQHFESPIFREGGNYV